MSANILSVENLSKSFGFKPLLASVSLGIDAGELVGLIGANGAGKSTFMRIVAGLEPADGGRVVVSKAVTLVYLGQNPPYDPEETILDHVFPETSPATALVRAYEIACRELADAPEPDERLLARVAALTEQMGREGAWDLEANAKTVLSRLGVADVRRPLGALSGGERKRVSLARALVARPDFLLLDEPTNHLDVETAEWLEGYLAEFRGAVLLVTHDRYFLDRVVDRILEIENGEIRAYAGNYAYYVAKKAEHENAAATAERRRVANLERELAWLARGARARTTKEKARIRHVEALEGASGPARRQSLEIDVASSRLGKKILELDHVSKRYGDLSLVEDLTYSFGRRDRVGIVGPNGSGKTTLLDMIARRLTPDAGEVRTGATVVVGYYDQEIRDFDPEERAIDYVKGEAGEVSTSEGERVSASAMLERFLFARDTHYAPIGKLSGGERRRLFLLKVLMGAPNLLLLDEPTNDLDLATLVALEEYLETFAGCVVAVSHDRAFLDRLAAHLFAFEGNGRIEISPGNYTAYRERRDAERAGAETRERAAPPARKTPAPAERAEAPQKLTFKERRELEELEAAIDAEERRKSALHAELEAAAADHERLRALAGELAELERALEARVARWAELAERA